MTDLATPTIHLNGSSRAELLRGLCEAYRAVHEAGRKLAAAAPHGRDYYPQTGDAIGRAMDQHAARLDRLHTVAAELEAIAIAIQE